MPDTEETIRIDVARCLAGQLARADRMLAVCEKIVDFNDSECIDAVTAASRLLRSDAQVAVSVARMIQLETRHRSITERPELNSKKIEAPMNRVQAAQRFDEKMARLIAETERESAQEA